MTDMTVRDSAYDFTGAHAALQRYVDGDLLVGVSSAVLVGQDLVDVHCTGLADREKGIELRTDHIFRAFSNTKLITSIAVLLLWEEGRFQLDDPIERYIPALGERQVLRPDATSAEDIEPAQSSITIRQLLTHSSGLSYGVLDPGTLAFSLYSGSGLHDPRGDLERMVEILTDLPLTYQPGTNWEYSIATDVLGRLVEVISGQRFDVFIAERIFAPLDMVDTGFVVPEDKRDRFAAYYEGADLMDPMKPGLTRNDNFPFRGAYLVPVPRHSGGGGLVTSLPDMVALMRALLPGGPQLLKPGTVEKMMQNHLPDGQTLVFSMLGPIPGKGYGLGGAVTLEPSSLEPAEATGEFQWGGIAGTHWWINPRHNMAGLLMTQRQMAFWHPFSFAFKKAVYKAVLDS